MSTHLYFFWTRNFIQLCAITNCQKINRTVSAKSKNSKFRICTSRGATWWSLALDGGELFLLRPASASDDDDLSLTTFLSDFLSLLCFLRSFEEESSSDSDWSLRGGGDLRDCLAGGGDLSSFLFPLTELLRFLPSRSEPSSESELKYR